VPLFRVKQWDHLEHGIGPNIARETHSRRWTLKRQISLRATF
jgi:hypothetical protein